MDCRRDKSHSQTDFPAPRAGYACHGKLSQAPDVEEHNQQQSRGTAGIAEGVIQRIGDWKTRSGFERYAIVTRTDIADAIRKLEAHEREHVIDKSHVLGQGDTPKGQVAKLESIN